MKKQGLLNPELAAAVVRIGHTDTMVIADAGLPIPSHAKVVDLSLIKGVPSFTQVLDAICQELVVESYILAEEIKEKSPRMFAEIEARLQGLPCVCLTHKAFKDASHNASVFVRTGETTPYANVILVGGVNF